MLIRYINIRKISFHLQIESFASLERDPLGAGTCGSWGLLATSNNPSEGVPYESDVAPRGFCRGGYGPRAEVPPCPRQGSRRGRPRPRRPPAICRGPPPAPGRRRRAGRPPPGHNTPPPARPAAPV